MKLFPLSSHVISSSDNIMDFVLGLQIHLDYVPHCRGRVAFITGGGSGIGFRIAEIFMRYGAARAGPCEGSAGRSHRPSVAGTAVGPPSPAGTNSAWPR